MKKLFLSVVLALSALVVGAQEVSVKYQLKSNWDIRSARVHSQPAV